MSGGAEIWPKAHFGRTVMSMKTVIYPPMDKSISLGYVTKSISLEYRIHSEDDIGGLDSWQRF